MQKVAYRKLYVSQIVGIVNLTKMKLLLRDSLGRQTSIWLIKRNVAYQKAKRRITEEMLGTKAQTFFLGTNGRFTPRYV